MQNSKEILKQTGKLTGTFYFKRFKVEDGNSTMRVGTDAVLLGASVEVSGAGNILEIGTGCGVIAIMLAQRSTAMIDAIDIDEESVIQARKNVENCPWKNRLNVIHTSLQEYTAESQKKYDLIVSNPPYFFRSLKSPYEKRNISRHNDSLGFAELVKCSIPIMNPGAGMWVILPVRESRELLEIASGNGMNLHSIIRVFGRAGNCQQRNIMNFCRLPVNNPVETELILRNYDNSYSDEYKLLTRDFYLDF